MTLLNPANRHQHNQHRANYLQPCYINNSPVQLY